MLIFQINDDSQVSQEEREMWEKYLKTENVVLLPSFIDFICEANREEGEEINIEES